MSTTLKRQSTKAHHYSTTRLNILKHVKFARFEILQKRIIGKRMFKVKAAQEGRSKNYVKHSAWIQSFFNFHSSQIKSDDIQMKQNWMMFITQKWGKPTKVLK